MKRFTALFAAFLSLAAAVSTAQAETKYWDITGATPGATNGDGVADGDWSAAATNWNTDPTGGAAGTISAWTTTTDDAVFSAGSDVGTDPTVAGAFVTVDATQTANSVTIEEGYIAFRGGAVDTAQTTVNAGAILDIDSISRYSTLQGKITLQDGATFKQSNPGSAGSFMRNSQTLEIGGTSTIVYEGGGGGCNCSIFIPINNNTIAGIGGTTTNGGAGTLVKEGAGEFRFQGLGLPLTTYAKLVINDGLFRLGSSSSVADERGFGAEPLAPLVDAITINGGAIGTSFGVTLHANRGITIGPNNAWFNNSASTMTVPSVISGVGSLNKDIDPNLIKGSATASGRLNLTSANGNTYGGGSNINAGTLAVFNTSGSGTGSGPVNVGGSSTTQFGTVMGKGSISGLTTLNQFGELRPGGTNSTDNAGTMTLNGGLTLSAGSLLTYQIGSAGNDLAVVGGVNGLNIAGAMTLNLLANGTVSGGTIPIIDYDTSFVGSLNDIVLGTTPTGFTYALVNNAGNTSIDLVVTAPGGLTGDYNSDGKVDAADYVLWRKSPGSFGGDPAGYNTWRANFGTGSPGSGSSLSGAAVPEPGTLVIAIFGLVLGLGISRRR